MREETRRRKERESDGNTQTRKDREGKETRATKIKERERVETGKKKKVKGEVLAVFSSKFPSHQFEEKEGDGQAKLVGRKGRSLLFLSNNCLLGYRSQCLLSSSSLRSSSYVFSFFLFFLG